MRERTGRISGNKFGFTKRLFIIFIFFGLFMLSRGSAHAQYTTWDESKVTRFYAAKKFDENELKESFDKFVGEIDSLNLTRKYPEIVRKLLSHNAREQEIALKMLAASRETEAIPWILMLLNSEDVYVKVGAGSSLQQIVSARALQRRDADFPAFVVIKPLPKTDADLKPLAWIVLKMLRSDETNHISYAITMARYLNLYEFEDEIARHQNSIHPAITNTMKWALNELQLQKKYDSNELKKEK